MIEIEVIDMPTVREPIDPPSTWNFEMPSVRMFEMPSVRTALELDAPTEREAFPLGAHCDEVAHEVAEDFEMPAITAVDLIFDLPLACDANKGGVS